MNCLIIGTERFSHAHVFSHAWLELLRIIIGNQNFSIYLDKQISQKVKKSDKKKTVWNNDHDKLKKVENCEFKN